MVEIYNKTCTTCGIEKSITQFHKSGRTRTPEVSQCKTCVKSRNAKYYQQRKEYIKARNERWRINNYELRKEIARDCYHKRKAADKITLRDPEKEKQRKKRYKSKNRELLKISSKVYRDKNREKLREKGRVYYYDNKNKYKDYQKKNLSVRAVRQRIRSANDPVFKMRKNLSSRLNITFKRMSFGKKPNTHQLLGCNFVEAKQWIENQFKDGMTWNNYGKWHIDHIVPLSSSKNLHELNKLCHIHNLQPLWALDNMRKGNKVA